MVQAEVALELVDAAQAHQLDGLVLLQDRQHVERQVLHVVDLAQQQGVGAGRLVGHHAQRELIDLHVLGPGEEVRRFLARHIGGVALQHHGVARPPLVLEEAERTRTDRVADALVGRRRGEPGRHHHRQRRVGLAQHLEQQRERLLQHQLEGLGIGRRELFRVGHQHLAQRVAHRPALEGGHAILGRDRAAVVPLEAVAQGEGPGELVGAAVVALDHLWLDLALLVHGEQHVEDMQAECTGDGGGDDVRIEDRHLRFQHHRQRLRCPRLAWPDQRRRRQRRAACHRRPAPKSTYAHPTPPAQQRAA
jgi:hypothetical protein